MSRHRTQQGMVLIFSLWVLGILTILAVSVAVGIRQKIFLIRRLDERSRMEYLLQAAVKKAAGFIHEQMAVSSAMINPQVKMNLFNNTHELSQIKLGQDSSGVWYMAWFGARSSLRWGVVDEESKINLNKTDQLTLTNLLARVLSLKEEDAVRLALALLDWRKVGEGELHGYFSDDYYSNLQYPYLKKSAPYETLNEILLVKGMNKKMYDKIINYITIYGDGAVNVNTASQEVLLALGLPEELVDKILSVRRGKDGMDATPDDHVFKQSYEIAADINALIRLNLDEAHMIDVLNNKGLLTTNSFYFTIKAAGKLWARPNFKTVRAIYSARDDKIIYWTER
ncbi:MAG: general secretion pathway protein GspK [Candidatus Omnitrophica bacterium]|nr:general secretion pathway protein GspK [Candidatus Omnitrophota bacterium]